MRRSCKWIDPLWHKYVGSHHIRMWDEVNFIRDKLDLPMPQKYALYLHTKWWSLMRYRTFVRDGKKCVLCGSKKKLSVDHVNYPGFGKERLKDLRTLCLKCHAQHTRHYDLMVEKDKVWEVE